MARLDFHTVSLSMAMLIRPRKSDYPSPSTPALTLSRQAIITLPDATCPDYAQKIGTCGTYSYANESLIANSTHAAAPNFYKALQGFMGALPQYSRNSFHFSSESYGGHYGPIFNEYIEAQNAKNIPGSHHISLETVMIGYDHTPISSSIKAHDSYRNGWYDPLLQYQAYYNYT